MSMNFSEFKRILGAEPRSRDPAFRIARDSSPEFARAADEAEAFEDKLEHAARIPCPDGLVDDLIGLGRGSSRPAGRSRWMALAVAASLLLAFGATLLYRSMYPTWPSVDAYLVDHYRHDGQVLIDQADGTVSAETEQLLEELKVRAMPELAGIIGVEALLVDLPAGSAAIIGTPEQDIRQLYATVHAAIVPLAARS